MDSACGPSGLVQLLIVWLAQPCAPGLAFALSVDLLVLPLQAAHMTGSTGWLFPVLPTMETTPNSTFPQVDAGGLFPAFSGFSCCLWGGDASRRHPLETCNLQV